MLCRKCNRDLPEDAVYCCYCGVKQAVRNKRSRSHGNGLGSVYRPEGSRTWIAEITTGFSISERDGVKSVQRNREKKKGFKTKKEGEEYLAKRRMELEEEKMGKQVITVKTVEDLYNEYRDTAMQSLKSKKTAYKIAFEKRIKPAIGDYLITAVSLHELNSIVSTLTYNQAKDVRDLMSNLFNRAMADRMVDRSPIKFITMPENNPSEVPPWSSDEVTKLWDAWGKGNRTAGLCLLMIYSGMMPGEMFALKQDMIHWDTNTIIGCGMKTKKRKEAPIVFPSFVAPVLQELCETSTSRNGFVFGMNRDYFYDDFHKMKESLGIRPEVRPYSGRHSTGTELALKGVAPALIVEIMRHKKYAVTLEHYTQIPTSDLVAALELMSPSSEKPERET